MKPLHVCRTLLAGTALLTTTVSCGQTTPISNSAYPAWTREEIQAAEDLKDLGELKLAPTGEWLLGEKTFNFDDIQGKFYSKNRYGPDAIADPMAIKAGPEAVRAKFIASSYSDAWMFPGTCSNPFADMTAGGMSGTQAASSAKYLAVDGKLYRDGQLRDFDFRETSGPTVGIATRALSDRIACLAALFTRWQQNGWHKGIDQNDGHHYYNTSDNV